MIKLTLFQWFLQIFHITDRPECSLNNLVNSKNFLNKILFGDFCEFNLLLNNANVLSHSKYGPYGMYTKIPIQFLPYRKKV